MSLARTKHLSLTLREVLTLVTLAAFSCAALRWSNRWWLGLTATIAGIFWIRSVTLAFVDRGPRQAGAIGFAVAALLYAGLVGVRDSNRETEMDRDYSLLPTSQALKLTYFTVFGLEESIYQTTGTAADGMFERRECFLPIGHLLLSIAFGLVASRYAQFVYSRRDSNKHSPVPIPDPSL